MPKRRKQKRSTSRASASALPKGAYRLPEGGYTGKPSTTYYKNARGQLRKMTVQGAFRDQPDADSFAKVLLKLAKEEKEKRDAESETS